MSAKCPGNDTRTLTVGMFPCPKCCTPVELFSDEVRRRCPRCKEWVVKQEMPSCVQWCKSARECLGEERWKEIMGQMDKTEAE